MNSTEIVPDLLKFTLQKETDSKTNRQMNM